MNVKLGWSLISAKLLTVAQYSSCAPIQQQHSSTSQLDWERWRLWQCWHKMITSAAYCVLTLSRHTKR